MVHLTSFIYFNIVDALCVVVPVALADSGDVVSLYAG